MLMLRRPMLKSISSFIFSLLLLTSLEALGQDTLRTYGLRIGIDLARFAYLFATPSQVGAEASVDLEIYKNIFPVFELGYNSISLDQESSYKYDEYGVYGRLGLDINLLPVKDRSVHHSIFVGTRYGLSRFQHQAENIIAPNGYWGDYYLDEYSNNVTGQWVEITGGVKTELVNNLFMGWTVRLKFLLSKGKDEVLSPYLIPGYGKGNSNSTFGISYTIMYKIPLLKK
jgi:hypothetical protein